MIQTKLYFILEKYILRVSEIIKIYENKTHHTKH
jgi:hypothetical protein